MNSEYKYEVRAFRFQAVEREGCSFDAGYDTLKEARERARYVIGQGFMKQAEMSQPFGYVQVLNRFTGECHNDYFNDSVCQSCGRWYPGQHANQCACQPKEA